MENNKKMPEKKFKAGGITAAVWNNTRKVNGESRDIKTVSIERRYQDKEGNWQTSNTFTANDLAKLQLVAAKAYEYLVLGNGGAAPAAVEEQI